MLDVHRTDWATLPRLVSDAPLGVPRIAVVGCGYWGANHVRVLRTLCGADPVTMVDPRDDCRDAMVERHPGLRAFASLEAALPGLDAVVIATPPATHASLALQAIAAGKHVLVEKPLATSVQDAEMVVRAARAAGVTLMVGHTFLFHPAVWRLRDALWQGELGRLRYLETARLNLGLYQRDVNVLWDLAPHDVSIVNALVGAVPTAVQAWGGMHTEGTPFEDVAWMRLEYGTVGVTAQVEVSWLAPEKVRRMQLVGDRRMAVWDDLNQAERVRIYDRGVAMVGEVGAPRVPRYWDEGSHAVAVDMVEPLALEDADFLDSIRTGTEPCAGGEAGLEVVRVIEAAQRSLREGRRVVLSDPALRLAS